MPRRPSYTPDDEGDDLRRRASASGGGGIPAWLWVLGGGGLLAVVVVVGLGFALFTARRSEARHEAARLRPELDLTRVGIRGWSFGGSLAALAVLRRPDVFHAAVAGAGVTDQRLYHAQWRERFLGHPDDFPGRYEESSLVRAAPRLTRPLLLIHGLADANVHPANTLRLSAALLAAGRAHEVLLLPGVGHQAMGSAVAADLLRHQLRFLRRHLGASPDPAARPPG